MAYEGSPQESDDEFDEIARKIEEEGGLPSDAQITDDAVREVIAAIPDVNEALARNRLSADADPDSTRKPGELGAEVASPDDNESGEHNGR